ncbi:unnamed protein product [Pylaiella littoralis]
MKEMEMDEPLTSSDHLRDAGRATEESFRPLTEAGGVMSLCFRQEGSSACCGDQDCFDEEGSLANAHGLLSVAEIQSKDLKTVVWNGTALTVLYLVAGGIWFMVSDGWSMTETVYFMTTSLLTVGYGDVVVRNGPKNRILDVVLIVLGLMTVTVWAACASRALHTIRSRKSDDEGPVPAFDASAKIRKCRWMLFHRLVVIVVVLIIGVVVFMGGENAGFTEGFYWAVVTASTIGYGDVVPTTSPMRWFTTFFSIVATVSMLETLRVAGAYPFRIWKLQAEAKVFEQFTNAKTASERDAAAVLAETAVEELLGIPPERMTGVAVSRSDATLAMLLLLNRVSYDDVHQAARIFDKLGNRRVDTAAVAAAAPGSVRTSLKPEKR